AVFLFSAKNSAIVFKLGMAGESAALLPRNLNLNLNRNLNLRRGASNQSFGLGLRLRLRAMMGKNSPKPVVAILMGSDSDWPTMKGAADACVEFSIPHEVRVI